jgi:hypothetical protein
VVACGTTSQEISTVETPEVETPAIVDQTVRSIMARPVENSPGSILQYTYHDMDVYFVPPACCDIPGVVFDHEGNAICYSGGLLRAEESQCPDFLEARTDEVLVWRDPRITPIDTGNR